MRAAAETNRAVHAKIEFSIAKGFSQRQKEQSDFHKNIKCLVDFRENLGIFVSTLLSLVSE